MQWWYERGGQRGGPVTEAGLLVASGTLHPGGLLDVSKLATGTYLFDFSRLKRYVRVVKN